MCKGFDEESKEHVGKVESGEPSALEGGAASELAIEEEGIICS